MKIKETLAVVALAFLGCSAYANLTVTNNSDIKLKVTSDWEMCWKKYVASYGGYFTTTGHGNGCTPNQMINVYSTGDNPTQICQTKGFDLETPNAITISGAQGTYSCICNGANCTDTPTKKANKK